MPKRAISDTVQLKLRMKEPDRAALEAAAHQRGVSLNTEIIERLRRTFTEDTAISDAFGNRRNYALMRLIASIIETMLSSKGPDTDWLRDAYLFDQVTKAITGVFEAIRPAEAPSPEEAFQRGGVHWGKTTTVVTLDEVKRADSDLSLAEPSKHEQLKSMLKADLGDVVERAQLPLRTLARAPDEPAQDGQPAKGAKGKSRVD